MKRKWKGFNWHRIFSSIYVKIAVVFTLTLLVTLEVIGTFFVKQLENQNLEQLRTQIALKPYVTDSLTEDLSEENYEAMQRMLTSINNPAITEILVVDEHGIIRATNNVNSQDRVGKKSTQADVKAALSGTDYRRTPIELRGDERFQLTIRPLIHAANGQNKTVGVVVVRANLKNVYDNLNNISMIFLSASVLAIVLGFVMAIIISRSLARPITEINDRTIRIAKGDYSGTIEVRTNDEIGQLAQNVNTLASRIEETTNSIDFERRRLDSVLEYMTDGVLATDRRGNINMINSMAARMLGIEDGSDAIGKSILKLLGIQDEYTLRDLLDQQQELMLDLSDTSQTLYLKAYFSLIQRSSGFISGLVIVLHDVTEQYKIENERRQFVSNVSHELRTPLTSVKSYVDALQEGAIEDKELSRNFLSVVEDETARMIRMINDLLELSRMDSSTLKIDQEYVNIGELFNYILDRFDMIIANDEQPEKRYSIARDISAVPIWVELDPSKFTQVVDNVMNNAIKYSPDGGVITAEMVDHGNRVVLGINDQGLGIPAADLKHVFDRFFRVDKARSRAQGGSGLGLAISKEIIERFGGRIWVESVEGKGSTFYISLPYEAYDLGEDDWDE
ncbi:cell wall metabolism sensor histidine kinase WalK [Weissella ceti]|uniref:cell wall metabolism sensor histidine kinase WalK n=1 Tax=Weissella ceti TaxID=759620 RepID=UPI001BCBCFB7|nr:cell wall metabolism sensor histidine kinase WalK [Weissella ceti]QVK12156.1 cell wall metabolism sensor histidine kinase WalK [Weissella ceti]